MQHVLLGGEVIGHQQPKQVLRGLLVERPHERRHLRERRAAGRLRVLVIRNQSVERDAEDGVRTGHRSALQIDIVLGECRQCVPRCLAHAAVLVGNARFEVPAGPCGLR